MIGTRGAWLAVSLFVAGPAIAATPSDGRTVWVPAGDAVVVVPKGPTRQVDFPAADMFGRQEAMRGMPQVAPGSSVVMTLVSIPGGTCSQTIFYEAPSQGAQPVVEVVSSGNACGALQAAGPINLVQSAVQQPYQRSWTIGYPARPIDAGVPPRT